MIRRPPRSTPKPSSAASDVYKRQVEVLVEVDVDVEVLVEVDVDVEVLVEVDVEVEVLVEVDRDVEVLAEVDVDVEVVDVDVDVLVKADVDVDVLVEVDLGKAVLLVGSPLAMMRVAPAEVCEVVMVVSIAITVVLMVAVEGRHSPPDKLPNT